MSTRSHIGIRNADGSLDVIYCHYDGYPSHNGAILFQHYQDPEKVRALIQLGDISSLAPKVAPDEGVQHDFEHKQEGVVVAYGRDRHEPNVQMSHYDNEQTYMQQLTQYGCDVDYIYIYDRCMKCWFWARCSYEDGPRSLQPLTKEDIKE